MRVRIDTIAAGGDGLGREPEGRVVFIPRTAPGDLVEAEVVESHAQWSRARVVELVEPGPGRRAAPCPFYSECGGCQIQHMDYGAQVDAKSVIVGDALNRLGGLALDPPAVVPSPRQLGYRNRVSLTLRRHDERVSAGYHHYTEPDTLVDVDYCPLAEPAINSAWAALRAAWGPGANQLPAGPELRLTLRATDAGDVGLVIEGGDGRGDPESLLQAVEELVAIWSIDRRGALRWHAGASALEDHWSSRRVRLRARSFVQVNRELAPTLEAYVRDQLGVLEGRRVIDAYCGSGARTLQLAEAGADAIGIDADGAAISAARLTARETDTRARFYGEHVENRLPQALPAEIVVLNPPRAGVAGAVIDALTEAPPERLVYVSCDPATLARDLKALAGTLQIKNCRAFDMFPQTAHVETVVTLAG